MDPAVPGVSVRDNRNRHHITHEAGDRDHLFHGHETDVWLAEQRVGYSCPRDVDSGKALLLDQPGKKCVERAGSDDRGLSLEQVVELERATAGRCGTTDSPHSEYLARA